MKHEAYIIIEAGIAIPLKHAAVLADAVRVDSKYEDGYQYSISRKGAQAMDAKVLSADYVAGMIAEDKLK